MITYTIDRHIKTRKVEDFINVPKIITVNEFTEKSAKEFRKEFAEAINTGQPLIPIEIDSFGGQVYSLMSMIDTIQASPVPVATYATGKAMSCGALLFSFGAEGMRFISPNATLLIHDVSSWTIGKIEDLKNDVKHTDYLNQKVYRMLAKNCGQHESYFLDQIHEIGHVDWYLTADDCIKHKVANKIGLPTLKVNVGVEMSFG